MNLTGKEASEIGSAVYMEASAKFPLSPMLYYSDLEQSQTEFNSLEMWRRSELSRRLLCFGWTIQNYEWHEDDEDKKYLKELMSRPVEPMSDLSGLVIIHGEDLGEDEPPDEDFMNEGGSSL